MPIGRGGGIADVEGGESEGFLAALDDDAAGEAPTSDADGAEVTVPVTTLSDGWVLGS